MESERGTLAGASSKGCAPVATMRQDLRMSTLIPLTPTYITAMALNLTIAPRAVDASGLKTPASPSRPSMAETPARASLATRWRLDQMDDMRDADLTDQDVADLETCESEGI